MFTIERITHSIVRGTSLLCGVLSAAVFIFLPGSVHAQCADWDANGYFVLIQPKSKPMDLNLVKNGKSITGTAHSIIRHPSGNGERDMGGKVDGTLDGDSFSVQIYWDNFQTGVYNGKVLLSGRIDGEAYEKSSPNVLVPWHTDNFLKCAPPPRPKPITRSGRAMPAVQPAAPPLKPPFITAGPPIRLPGLPVASVYLGWDGGPDHPNAEVWVSINDQTEISAALLYGPALKQPKIGAIELKLQGGLYKYFLKDAGTTLSTVIVAVP